ncbi:MAG TPA: hypothetical protein VHG29_06695 [Novosphingobium sp.]|nr:hypothetical protein [Novosphingobium sp.]
MRNTAASLLMTTLLPACSPVHGDSLDAFERVLAAHDSATAALGEWCERQGIAVPEITAMPVGDGRTAEPDGLRAELAVDAREPLGFRHVRLACGETVLSEAYNWYVPARLTPEMNTALADGRTPFGRIAAPLGFRRERLDSKRGSMPGCPAGTVLRQRGLLRLPDGTPLSLVNECYLAANLGHEPPN